MNVVTPVVSPKLDVLERVRRILPEIEARADEIERGAKVPMDLLQKLEEAGAFRMILAARFGGEEMTHEAAAQVIEEVACADASVAWHIVVSSGTHVFTTCLPLASLEEFYAQGANTFAKASGQPKGIAVPVEGGYRLSGYWQLASGARHFDWVCLGFMIKEGDGIRRLPSGMPDIRVCLVPRDGVEVIETWDAVGLRGTRSDDMQCQDKFVPEAWQGQLFAPSDIDIPLYSISVPLMAAAHHTAVVNGILRGAIADIAASALIRRPTFNPAGLVKDDPVFQSRFGELASRVDGIRALTDMCVNMIETCCAENRDATPAEAAKIASGASLMHHDATAVMDQLMLLSGSAGLYTKNRIQRRWRDLRCMAQHQAANQATYLGYARSLTAAAAAAAA